MIASGEGELCSPEPSRGARDPLRVPNLVKGTSRGSCTGHHHAGMHGLSRAELLDDEEQAGERREARALEVLPPLPQAHQPQRNQVTTMSSRAVALMVEQRTPNPRVGGSSPSCPAWVVGAASACPPR